MKAPADAPSAGLSIADDTSIVDAARRGDRAAWSCLYRRYARYVHGVLISRVPPGDAEDLVHDVFAKAMRSIDTLRESACVGPWLAAVARNRATDHLRQRRRHRAVSTSVSPVVDDQGGSPAAVATELDARDVLAMIQRLPDAYRETVALRLIEGLTGPEIAARMGMTHGSVRVNLSRGMAMLRTSIGVEDQR